MTSRTVGVEEEFLLFHAREPRLLDIGPAVAEAAQDATDDDEAQFEKELTKTQTELASAPTDDLGDLASELAGLRAELVAAAGDRGARVVASGTSPVAGSAPTTDDARYREMAQRFAAVARRQLTCAMHVHVGVDSNEQGVAVLDRIAPWLPVLCALSANSPFHEGRDTGYAGYRRMIWDQWPTAGVTAAFGDLAAYRHTVDGLIASGAARDRGMIYFDARLSADYPTVEIRVCDVCPTEDDAVTLAGLCRALVTTAAQADATDPVRPELLRAASWRAARWGMAERLADLAADDVRLVPAWSLVDALLEHVGPALDAAGDRSRVTDGLTRIRKHGTGADAQRAAGSPAAAVDAMTLPS